MIEIQELRKQNQGNRHGSAFSTGKGRTGKTKKLGSKHDPDTVI